MQNQTLNQHLNNSLNQALQAKYPHLELAILPLSQVQKDNESKRIDSEYFKKEYLENEARLLHLNSIKLGKICSFICNGDDCRDYEENGLKYIRTGDIKEYGLDLHNCATIREDFTSNTKLEIGDLLITRKGNYGKSQVVDSDEILESIISSEIFQLKLKDINPYFVDIFLKSRFGQIQFEKNIHGVSNFSVTQEALLNFLIPQFSQEFQLEIEKLVKDSHKALEDSKALYKEAERLLYQALGLDSHNPLATLCHTDTFSCHTEGEARSISNNPQNRDISAFAKPQYDNEFSPSLRDSRFISSLRESANADSWQSISCNGEGKTHHLTPSAREGEQTICHTESVARSISNNPQNRDISLNAQYDKDRDSSLSTKAQNDNVMDCHENSNEFSRNDTLSCHTNSPLCHTERSEVSKNTNTISQNHLDSSLRASHFAQNDNVVDCHDFATQNLAMTNTDSPSRAEGARGWVNPSYSSLRGFEKVEAIQNKNINCHDLLRKSRNDCVVDCHADKSARNDAISCHTERSEVSQNHYDRDISVSAKPQYDKAINPPSLAEGVRGWVEKYPHLNLSIRALTQSYGVSGRLDSEYYQTKYDAIERKIKGYQGGYCKLRDLVLDYSGGFAFSSDDYLENGDLALIRIANIKNADLDMSNAVYLKNSAKDLSPKDKVKQGDILISMSGSIGLSCVIRENIEAMANQRILKIAIKDFNGEVLVLLLNSIFCKLQFERVGTGGVQTNISSSDILNILIPKINSATQEQIACKIQKSFALRKKSKDLLQSAKIKVEQNIQNRANQS